MASTCCCLNGRRNNLEYGSYAPDAPRDVFIDDAGFRTAGSRRNWSTSAWSMRRWTICASWWATTRCTSGRERRQVRFREPSGGLIEWRESIACGLLLTQPPLLLRSAGVKNYTYHWLRTCAAGRARATRSAAYPATRRRDRIWITKASALSFWQTAPRLAALYA